MEDQDLIMFKLATESRFLDCLGKFESKVAYSNMRNDIVVGYCTAAVSLTAPEIDPDSDCARKGDAGVIAAIHDFSDCHCFPSIRKVYMSSGWSFPLPKSCDSNNLDHICRHSGIYLPQSIPSIHLAHESDPIPPPSCPMILDVPSPSAYPLSSFILEVNPNLGLISRFFRAAPNPPARKQQTTQDMPLPLSDLPDLTRDRLSRQIWEMYLGLCTIGWKRVDVNISYGDSFIWWCVDGSGYKAHEDIITKDCHPKNHGMDVVLHLVDALCAEGMYRKHRYGHEEGVEAKDERTVWKENRMQFSELLVD
eukprot:TRINITY_DN3364_c0_g2_i1.p1 TRINITY_DN3364_c0_g2~~TRINITY_DN3364_c0_g2_i1.p1  ORF type:complete len:348 (+),score=33.64 TRINITY_DN3364_c0_g2_i1:122-1045(+)